MAEEVLGKLRSLHPEVDFSHRVVTTRGDRDRRTQLSLLGGDYGGVFTKELEVALVAGEIDVAMHSLKDLPTVLPDGLSIAAVTARDEPGDALCGAHLASLELGARVGTGSPRRRAQLLHVRPDLDIVQVRGNIVPRLSRLKASASLAAIVLAAAGLRRVGLAAEATELLPVEEFVPAAGQGAIALEVRTADVELTSIVKAIEDPSTRASVTAERSVLHQLGGGCSVPLGAYCVVTDSGLRLHARVTSLDGRRDVEADLAGPVSDPERLGTDVAEVLLRNGAAEVLDEIVAGRT